MLQKFENCDNFNRRNGELSERLAFYCSLPIDGQCPGALFWAYEYGRPQLISKFLNAGVVCAFYPSPFHAAPPPFVPPASTLRLGQKLQNI